MAFLMQKLQQRLPFIETLQRGVNHRMRYYSLRIYKTLFNEYLLEIQYGSTKNKSPTGKKEHYYKNLPDALNASMKRVEEKLKKGYKKL
jgi:predicted DNA-binding WGR domain protein